MNIIVNGALGRMGQQVCRIIAESGATLAAAVDRAGGEGVYASLTDYTGPADVVIDFSACPCPDQYTTRASDCQQHTPTSLW